MTRTTTYRGYTFRAQDGSRWDYSPTTFAERSEHIEIATVKSNQYLAAGTYFYSPNGSGQFRGLQGADRNDLAERLGVEGRA